MDFPNLSTHNTIHYVLKFYGMKNSQQQQAAWGTLFIVATPIGHLDDISRRALAILQTVDYIYCEDTRHSKKLLTHYGITTPLRSLHEHNEKQRVDEILNLIQTGQSIALISDAGTPLISDPGYVLVKALRDAGISISPLPGPSALIAALSVAGVATDSFTFMGFLSAKAKERQQQLRDINTETRTVVLYESTHRIKACLQDIAAIMPQREIVLCKELTKQFETVISGLPTDILNWLNADARHSNGEFVLILAKMSGLTAEDDDSIVTTVYNLIAELRPHLSASDLAKLLSKLTGQKRQVMYQRCLDDGK